MGYDNIVDTFYTWMKEETLLLTVSGDIIYSMDWFYQQLSFNTTYLAIFASIKNAVILFLDRPILHDHSIHSRIATWLLSLNGSIALTAFLKLTLENKNTVHASLLLRISPRVWVWSWNVKAL